MESQFDPNNAQNLIEVYISSSVHDAMLTLFRLDREAVSLSSTCHLAQL